MWTPLIYLTLVGLVTCTTPWQLNQQYEYGFSADTLTGYGMGQDQYVGVVTKGKLVLQPVSETMVYGKLTNVRHGHFHGLLKYGLDKKIPNEELHFDSEVSQSEQPFVINLKNGVIRSLDVDSSMSNDNVNQLKAVLSPLQIDVAGQNVIKSRHNQMQGENNNFNNALYKTMEATITGECETMYEVSPVPAYAENWSSSQDNFELGENVFQFVKTVNFSNCDVRRGYHFGISGESDMKPNSNQMGEFLSKSTITRAVVVGSMNNFTIKSTETTNRVSVSTLLFDEQQAQVMSRIALELEAVDSVPSSNPIKVNELIHVGSLVYRYNIPSNDKNEPRLSDKNVNDTPSSSSSSSSSSSEENRKMNRERRSVKNHIGKHQRDNQLPSGSSSSSSSSSESSEEYNSQKYSARYPHHYQPHPELKKGPEQPLHPFTIGNMGRSIQYHNSVDISEECIKLAQEIESDLKVQVEIPERNTLEKFITLSDLIQTMDYKQIAQLVTSQKHGQQNNKNRGENVVYDVIMDAIAQAGTNPAVSFIVDSASNGQINLEDACSYLETACESLRTPTEAILREIFEKIIKNEQIRKRAVMYPKILVTYADLIHRAYSDKHYAVNYYPVQSFGSFEKGLNDLVTKDIVPYFGQRMAENIRNKNHKQSQMYIRALGNIGHPTIVGVFEPYLEGTKTATQFERLAQTAALDKLAKSYPAYAQKILYKIFANVADEPEIRSVAVALIMQADPSATMLQRMARSTYTDPSTAVRTAIKSAINSAAQLKTPGKMYLAANSRSAQKFLNPRTWTLQNSQTTFKDHAYDILRISQESQMSQIIGKDSIYPKAISYTSWKNLGGIKFDMIDIQALVSNVENIWETLMSDETSKDIKIGKAKYSTQRIAKQLGLSPSDTAQEISGQLLFKLLGRTNFFTFDQKSLGSSPKQYANLVKDLTSGQQFHYSKMYDHEQIIVAFPLATGYPFYFAYRTPILMEVVGEFKAKTTPNLANAQSWSSMLKTEAVNVTSKVNMTLSLTRIGKAGFITPFEKQRYVAGQVQKNQVHLPLSLTLNVDLKNTAVSGKIAPIGSGNDLTLLHLSNWPFTARKNVLSLRPVAEAKEIKLIETRPTVAFEEDFGDDSIGMGFTFKMQHQIPQNIVNAKQQLLQNHGMKQFTQLPIDLILTMQSLVAQRSPVSLNSPMHSPFDQVAFSAPLRNVLLSLLTTPLYDDFGTSELSEVRAALSLIPNFFEICGIDTADVENKNRPTSAVAQYKVSLDLDLQRSANQAMKFGIQFDRDEEFVGSAHPKGSSKPLSAFDESNLAVVSDIAPNSESRRDEMMTNAARDLKQPATGLIDSALVFDGRKPAKFVFTIAQADNAVGDKTRVLVFGSSKTATGGRSNQVYATYVQNFANTPALSYEKAEKHDGKSNAMLNILFGEGGKPNNTKINIKAVLTQTQDYKQQLEQSQVVRECVHQMHNDGNYQMPACLKATYQANLLNKINIVVESEAVTQQLIDIGHGALSSLNHWGYYNAKHDHTQKGKPGRAEVTVKFNPQQQSMNLTIQLPSNRQNFTGLPIPRSVYQALVVHPGLDLDERLTRAYSHNSQVCVVDNNKIWTFDNTMVEKQTLGNCWYALVQHNDSNYAGDELSVLVRKASEGHNNQREVLIIASDQQIHLSPSGGENALPKVTVNDKPQLVSQESAIYVHMPADNDHNKQLVARIYAISETDIKVELHGNRMKLYYDGEHIRVHADAKLRNELAGLCGNFNGEEKDDIATPQNKVLQNSKLYSAAWAVPDDACSPEVQQAQQRALSAPSYKVRYNAGNVVSNFENGKNSYGKQLRRKHWESNQDSSSSSSSSESNENEPSTKNNNKGNSQKRGNQPCHLQKSVQFVTSGNRYCFTKVEVDTCPNHCSRGDFTEIEVPAHCRDMKDSVAMMYVQQIRRGSSPDLGSKPENNNVSIKVPRLCQAKQ